MNASLFRILDWLKQIKFLRIMISPCRKRQINRLYLKYLQSDNRQKLEGLKNICKGKRCFIIGNGPSLKAEDLELLKDEFTFASNRIYEIFKETTWRPTVYIAVDENFVHTGLPSIRKVVCKLRLLPFRLAEKGKIEKERNEIFIWSGAKKYEVMRVAPWADKSAYIPEDVSLGFSEGRTVTFDAIQMALYMGFREIYLLGVDFNYSRVIDENGRIRNVDGVTDYFNQKTYDTTLQYYMPTKYAYIVAREYCDKHNVVIRNATRGGKLEVFERVDFDELF